MVTIRRARKRASAQENEMATMNRLAARAAADDPEEDCDVRIIRLRLDGLGVEGIARSFAAADKILLGWCACFQGSVRCLFEVVSFDGTVRCGQYVLPSAAAGKPALARLLRTVDAPAAMAAPDHAPVAAPPVVRRRIRLPAYRAGGAIVAGGLA
jgi:hypothetical protein